MAIYPESPSALTASLPDHSGPATILVSEDPFVSSFLRTVLQRHGHKVVTCEACYASELMGQGNMAADLVITNNPEAFLPLAGTLHMLYIAANPDLDVASHFPACRVLRKPFRNVDLVEAVDQLTHTVVH